MFQKLAILLFVGLSFPLAIARAAPVADLAQKISTIRMTIPQTLDEAARKSVVERLTSMVKHQFVYLDLTLIFSSSSDIGAPFSVTVNGKPTNKVQDCQFGGLLMGEGVEYALGPIANYNHLLMSVTTGDRSLFPYHDVSCEYLGNSQKSGFRVRGFFHVLSNSIPTALGLQLRPFNPPFELARKVLQGG